MTLKALHTAPGGQPDTQRAQQVLSRSPGNVPGCLVTPPKPRMAPFVGHSLKIPGLWRLPSPWAPGWCGWQAPGFGDKPQGREPGGSPALGKTQPVMCSLGLNLCTGTLLLPRVQHRAGRGAGVQLPTSTPRSPLPEDPRGSRWGPTRAGSILHQLSGRTISAQNMSQPQNRKHHNKEIMSDQLLFNL